MFCVTKTTAFRLRMKRGRTLKAERVVLPSAIAANQPCQTFEIGSFFWDFYTWETPCINADDDMHCECWYDGGKCCRCGGGIPCDDES